MDTAPAYVSLTFVLTTLLTVGFLFRAMRAEGMRSLAAKILVFSIPLWLMLQAVLALGGFYQVTDTVPPRLIVFGILPAVLLIVALSVFFRPFVEQMPLRVLTLLHVVRIPVEIVLYWLFVAGLVPEMMTFTGRNLDILSGLLAVVAYFTAFRDDKVNRHLLLIFNLFGLNLLAVIVSIAALSLPSPMQQLNFDNPNRGVLLFPYIWLPTIIVPIVLFSHLAALWQLLRKSRAKSAS